jgi:hypothetical protein
MKLKFVLISIFMYCLSVLFISVQAQGLYNNNSNNNGSNNSGTFSSGLRGGPSNGGGGVGDSGEGDQGGKGNEEPGEDSDQKLPVGEGIFILSFLAGGYAVLKKQQKKRNYEI